MKLNDEIKDLVAMWRPTFGNQDDIEIWRRINSPIGKFKAIDKEQEKLILLIKKRLKEGAIKSSLTDNK